MIRSGLRGRATGLDFLLATKRFLKVLDQTMCFNHAFIEKAFGAATPKIMALSVYLLPGAWGIANGKLQKI
jgi:hypothetical protein